jgi:hypothetical protein
MTLPSALLGLLIALLLASLFHVWVDGGLGRLLLYFFLSVAGFAVGQWVAARESWTIVALGPLHLGMAVLGSLLFLIVGHWLSLVRIDTGGPGPKV